MIVVVVVVVVVVVIGTAATEQPARSNGSIVWYGMMAVFPYIIVKNQTIITVMMRVCGNNTKNTNHYSDSYDHK